MLDIISDNADFLIAAANTALDASLVPTMLNQQRDKASTVPLTTSVASTALWLFTAVVFASISLWITMCAAIHGAILRDSVAVLLRRSVIARVISSCYQCPTSTTSDRQRLKTFAGPAGKA